MREKRNIRKSMPNLILFYCQLTKVKRGEENLETLKNTYVQKNDHFDRNFSGCIIYEIPVTTTQDQTICGTMVQLFLKLDFPKIKRKPPKTGG